jgi:hypothetical protein
LRQPPSSTAPPSCCPTTLCACCRRPSGEVALEGTPAVTQCTGCEAADQPAVGVQPAPALRRPASAVPFPSTATAPPKPRRALLALLLAPPPASQPAGAAHTPVTRRVCCPHTRPPTHTPTPPPDPPPSSPPPQKCAGPWCARWTA